jgi:hypothetical protein
MSKIRNAFVAVVLIAVAAGAVGLLTNPGPHHRTAPFATVVRAAPAPASPPSPPSSTFDAETFLNLMTRVEPAVATQLINSSSPADRAALAADVQLRIGLAAE